MLLQAEGAIEGRADQYEVPSPYATDFAFSRFEGERRTAHPPRRRYRQAHPCICVSRRRGVGTTRGTDHQGGLGHGALGVVCTAQPGLTESFPTRPHYLYAYTPGDPECEGKYEQEALRGGCVGRRPRACVSHTGSCLRSRDAGGSGTWQPGAPARTNAGRTTVPGHSHCVPEIIGRLYP